jgi:hypothetical protein
MSSSLPPVRAGLLAALLLAGCQGGGDADRVAALEKKVDAIDGRLAKLEAFLKPYLDQPPPRPEPDPRAVYAVPIEGAPTDGPASAQVTIVEAFEFA